MEKTQNMQQMKSRSYKKLWLIMLISFIIMYGVMFLNVDDASHIYLSITRTYMALLMVLGMAPVMMLLMGSMYPNKRLNASIIVGSIVLFGIITTLLRTQTPVSDVEYMKAMIPHHSSAIMTSKHANIKDPEVKALSDSIIKSQEEEIAQMKDILQRMNKEK